jgi:hypothetical protein
MKVGDVVMFVDKGTYSKWFYGNLAVIENCSAAKNGEIDSSKHHVRVQWMEPVQYFNRMATVSDFPAKYFESWE